MELINYTKHFKVCSTSVTNHCPLLRTFKSLFMVSLKKINYLATLQQSEYRLWLKKKKNHCWVHRLLSPGFVFQSHHRLHLKKATFLSRWRLCKNYRVIIQRKMSPPSSILTSLQIEPRISIWLDFACGDPGNETFSLTGIDLAEKWLFCGQEDETQRSTQIYVKNRRSYSIY